MECTPFAWEVAWFYSGRNPFRIFPSFASLSPERGDPRKSSTVRFRGFQCFLFLLFCYQNKGKICFSKGSVRSPELLRELGWNCWKTLFVPSFNPFAARPRISGPGYQENQLQEKHGPLQETFGQKIGDADGDLRMLGLGLGKEQLPQSRKLSHVLICDVFPQILLLFLWLLPLHPLRCQGLWLWWNWDVIPGKVLLILLENRLCVKELKALRAVGCWKDPLGSALCSAPKKEKSLRRLV